MPTKGSDSRDVLLMVRAALEQADTDTLPTKIGLVQPSDRKIEDYLFSASIPGFREWIGERELKFVDTKPFEIRNRKFESTFGCAIEDLDRDKTGVLSATINEWASETVTGHWMELILELINANGICFDGTNFFSANHTFGMKAATRNTVSSSEISSLNIADAADPKGPEVAKAILDCTGYMQTWQNSRNRPINQTARNFIIITSNAAYQAAALEAITSETFAGSQSNPLNGLMKKGYSWDVLVDPRRTGDTSFDMFRTDGFLKPYILQNEKDPKLNMLDENSEHAFKTDTIAVGVKCRRGAGYGFWQTALRATFN